MIAAVGAFPSIGAGVNHPSANQLLLYPEEDFLRNNGFMVALHIVLRNNAVILDAGLVQKIGGVGLLQQGVADNYITCVTDLCCKST